MSDQFQKVLSDLSQTRQDLQNFMGKTDHLADSQLPSLKEGFGIDDIFSIGGTAILKKEMKELIDNVTHYIHNNKSLLVDFQQQLDGFQYKASSISMLGDLVNFYKQKAIMLMTVHVFHAPNVDITTDDSLHQINSVIQNIGMVVSVAMDVAGFPEIGMALQAIFLVVGVIFSVIEIIKKMDAIKDCFNKLRPAYDRISFSNQKLHDSTTKIDQTFVDLKKFLVDIGNTKVDDDPKTIIGEMVAVQTAFNNVYTDYENLKGLMKSNPIVLDAMAETYKNQVGYGNVNVYTFFLVLYAEENLQPNEVADFLTKHGSQIPTGGVDKLVKIVEYIATTFHTTSVNVAFIA